MEMNLVHIKGLYINLKKKRKNENKSLNYQDRKNEDDYITNIDFVVLVA